MDEPKEGATTMKKKAQEKLAAKANPAPVADVVVEASEPTATEEVVETVVEATEAVAEAPAEVVVEAVVETSTDAAAE
jgi:small subunit ribosomal protein S16